MNSYNETIMPRRTCKIWTISDEVQYCAAVQFEISQFQNVI